MVSALEKDLEVTIENPAQKETEYFNKMKAVSKAGAGLLKFVYAIIGYNSVFREVKPKKDKVARLEKEFHDSSRELQKINSAVAFLNAYRLVSND